MIQLFTFLFFLFVCLASTEDPVVQTKCGPVQGNKDDHGLAQFLGIPFATPPVAQLRWKPPQPAACWNGTFVANNAGPGCTDSEDCLRLNVYSRFITNQGNSSRDKAPLVPVFFWLYGGGNLGGSNLGYPNLSYIPSQKDAVLVAPNFRLGLLGYLALKELSATDPRGVSGNYAIMDIQLALRWVQENIAAFGGDPKRVTLFGQSSGGTNIFSLLASPASKNLFHGAISLSGSPNITMDIHQAEEQNRKYFLPSTGCDKAPDVLKCLYALTPKKISDATASCYSTPGIGDVSPDGVNGTQWCGLTIADGVTVLNIFEATAKGIIDVPTIIQTQQTESDFFGGDNFRKMTPTQLRNYFQKWFSDGGWKAGAYEKWNELYSPSIANSVELAFFSFLTDIGFTCGNQRLAIHAGMGFTSPVYLGIVTYPPSHVYGVMHYAFHTWDYLGATQSFKWWQGDWNPEPADVLFGKTQLDMWYDLASTGKINPSYGWKPINSDPSFPNSFVVGIEGKPDSVLSVVNYSQILCNQLSQPPLDFDIRYWLINK